MAKRDSGAGRAKEADERASGGRERGGRDEAASTEKEDEAYLEAHGNELSESVRRAKWIRKVGEGPDRHGQTLATRNHEVIRAWAEARQAKPATTPGGNVERPRVLRFDFPGGTDGLQEVSWENWLRVFDARELVFIFQETRAAGYQSNFFRLDSPDREDG